MIQLNAAGKRYGHKLLFEAADLLISAVEQWSGRGRNRVIGCARRGHPARRTFQAIRMEVNRELPNLAAGLDDSVHVIGPEGRVLVLAYHSLEDRLVKETFADWTNTGSAPSLPKLAVPEPARNPLARLLTRRPLRPRRHCHSAPFESCDQAPSRRCKHARNWRSST